LRTTRFWLAVGTPENWHTAFDYGCLWGLKSSQRSFWEAIQENTDLVFFYSTAPVSGIVGYGIVRTKLQQNSPLWPAERAQNEVIWPLRFEFEVLAALVPNAWERQAYSTEALKKRARSGFQSLEPELAQQILHALPASADGRIAPPALAPELLGRELNLPDDPHRRAQFLVAEIGRMQRFLVETEYPLEQRRLDVVWRRVQRSVPSYVFEVQVSGNLTEAMAKLNQAYVLWNSHLFLVGRPEYETSVKQLLEGTFREIHHRTRFLEIGQVEELYQRKRAYRELESQLGILPGTK
jgi:hypothetical protein